MPASTFSHNGRCSKRIVLIACASKKRTYRAKAKDLYISPLFNLSLQYAQTINPDGIFILSAKHELLGLDQEIEPYEKTLNTMRASEIKQWASRVIAAIRKNSEVEETEFIFLAGLKYRQYLLPHLKHVQTPLEGLRIGEQLQRLGELIREH